MATTVRDLEYEMKVTAAQVELDSRRLEKSRKRLEEENENIAPLREFVSGEQNINANIEEHAELLTRLSQLYHDFPRIISRNAVVKNSSVEDHIPHPYELFERLISSVSIHHDALTGDIEAAKAELKDAEAEVTRFREKVREDEGALMLSQTEYARQEELLELYSSRLEALRASNTPSK